MHINACIHKFHIYVLAKYSHIAYAMKKDMTLLFIQVTTYVSSLLNAIIHWENPNYKHNVLPSGMAESKKLTH